MNKQLVIKVCLRLLHLPEIKVMRVILTLFLSFSMLILSAQESKVYQRHKKKPNYFKGFVITIDSTRVDGLIKKTQNDQYSTVTFISKPGIKSVYLPEELRGFTVAGLEYISADSRFFKVHIKSEFVSLYSGIRKKTEYNPDFQGNYQSRNLNSTKYFVKRPDEEEFTCVVSDDFRGIFSEYFKDCYEVKDKIERLLLTAKDIRIIVIQYNDCKRRMEEEN